MILSKLDEMTDFCRLLLISFLCVLLRLCGIIFDAFMNFILAREAWEREDPLVGIKVINLQTFKILMVEYGFHI